MDNFLRQKLAKIIGFGTLMLLLSVICPAQTPQFHRDCAAGQLLANGSCQPIATVLAAQGGTVYWVAKTGNDSNPGTQAQPWLTITKAAQTMVANDAVIVRAGTYRENFTPTVGGTGTTHRITYAAYTGESVIVSGADVLTGWTVSGNGYRRAWTTSLCANESTNGNSYRREMFIVDGTMLTAVYTRAEVVPGTFFVEGTSCSPTAVYIRLPGDAAPSGHTIEGAVRPQLFFPGVGLGYYRLIGFTFRYAPTEFSEQPSVKGGSAGSLIEENTVEWASSIGMSMSGTNNTYRGNWVNDNGQLGIAATCSGCLVEYNKTFRNNWKHFNISGEGGAMKFALTTNTIFSHHESANNYGNGIWFDIQNYDNVIEDCLSYNNLQSNLFLEAKSERNIVRNNILFGATKYVQPTFTVGGAGIILAQSPNNTIVNNTIFGNEKYGIWIENERTGIWVPDGAEGGNKIYNNIFVDNGTEIRFDAENQTDARFNDFDGNLYWNIATGTLFFLKYPTTTGYSGNNLLTWQQLLVSDAQSRIADPLLANLTSYTGWHLTSGSPARSMGVTPPVAVPSDYEDDVRPPSGADVGADEFIAINTPPTVSLTAPSDGQSFSAPANVVLTATASDPGGSVSKVEFYNGATLLGSDITSPYQFTWSGVGVGSYSVKAKAIDNAGASSFSPSICISVTTAIAFDVKINFQPTASAIPAGYVRDDGTAYGTRNGYTYGWNATNTANALERNVSGDQRYDTLIRMQSGGTFTWEIAVPNGTYSVYIVAGDPSFYASTYYKIEAEGVLTVDAAPTNVTRWREGTSTVTVSDGKLTISNAATGALQNKICFIEITKI